MSEELFEAQQRESHTKYAIVKNWAVVIKDNMDITFSYILFNVLTRALHSSLCIHNWSSPCPSSSSPSSFRQKDLCLCQNNRQAFTLNLLLSFETPQHSLFISTLQSTPIPSSPSHVDVSLTVQATYEMGHHESTRPETAIARSIHIPLATHPLFLLCPSPISLSASFYVFFSFSMKCTIKQSALFPKKNSSGGALILVDFFQHKEDSQFMRSWFLCVIGWSGKQRNSETA